VRSKGGWGEVGAEWVVSGVGGSGRTVLVAALECRLLSHVCSRAANYVLALSASALAPAKRGSLGWPKGGGGSGGLGVRIRGMVGQDVCLNWCPSASLRGHRSNVCQRRLSPD